MTSNGHKPTLTVRGVTLIVAVLACTALGGWRAAAVSSTPHPGPSTLVVNDVSYNVAHAEQVVGLSDSDLGGMSHGIQSLVTNDKALIKVTLVVSAGSSSTPYDAGVLRAYATGSPLAIPPVGGTLAPGQLSANARIEGSVSFVVPRNGAKLTLRALGSPREVALLQVDKATPTAGSGSGSAPGSEAHQHHPSTTTTPPTGAQSPLKQP